MRNNITFDSIYALPYTSTHPVAKEFPGFSLFSNRKDFILMERITAIGIMLGVEYTPIVSPKKVKGSFRADLYDADRNKIGSKSFSVCLDPDEFTRFIRTDMLVSGDVLKQGVYSLEIYRSGDDTIPVIARNISFYRLGKLPVRYFEPEEAYFHFNGQDYSAINTEDICSGEFHITLRHTFPKSDLPFPEARVRILTGDNSGSEDFETEIAEITDDRVTLRANVNLPVFHREAVFFQLRLFDMRLTGVTFSTIKTEYGRICGEDIVYIPEFTVEKGVQELIKRTERIHERTLKKNAAEATYTLDTLTGLKDVKKAVAAHSSFARYTAERIKAGLPDVSRPLHSIFLGNPGTGKTTVAKLMGGILKEAGVLSSGHVVIRERASLVGKYYNSESEAVNEALEQARGGILFIDEAYQLYQPDDPKDPGMMVFNALMTILADPAQRDWMLVIAGYTEPMLRMLEQNPGLDSRFPQTNRITFADYSAEELIAIAESYLEQKKFILTSTAKKALEERIMADYMNRDRHFGNARYVMNLIETEILPAMALRIASDSNTTSFTPEILSTIRRSDIPAPSPAKKIRQRTIGFAA